MFEYCIIFIPVFMVIGIVVDAYLTYKQSKKWGKLISNAKKQLSDSGLPFNHSLELTNIEGTTTRFLRIYDLRYDPSTKKVYARVYMTTKDGEIGTGYGDYEYLLDINTRWNIKDLGEWNSDD